METEIWPRLIHEGKKSGAKIAIVNGRLSEKSFRRYSLVKGFVRAILKNIDLGLMQGEKDAERIIKLGIVPKKVKVAGNLKFEHTTSETEEELTGEFRYRFDISPDKPLIIAASTHEPEERYVLESLDGELGHSCRLMIAPRHPERFNAVERLLGNYAYSFVKRSAPPTEADSDAAIILLDTIGELRAAYPLAEIVFVGGSLVRHGGQNVLEPAAAGKAIVTGPYTENFDVVIKEFLENDAIRQTPSASDDSQISERLYEEFILLLGSEQTRLELGQNAAAVMGRSNRGATAITIDSLRSIIDHK